MADLQIRTTITANSIQRLFGPPAINYRSHPNQREPDNPAVIFAAMRRKEIAPLGDIKMLKGTIYSFKNRKIITRWIRDVCAAFNLRSATLCLAVQLTDAYIISNLASLQVSECQLVAIVCTWISAKFEETDDMLPSLKSLGEVCDGAYTSPQILQMEEQILEGFRWRLPHSSCLNFLYLYLHMHGHPAVARQILEIRRAAAVAAEKEGNELVESPSRFPPRKGFIAVQIVLADATTKQRSYVPVYISADRPFVELNRELCTAARVHYTDQIEVYELAGSDFYLARRILSKLTPSQLGMRSGNDGEKSPVKLFLSTTASSIIGSSGNQQQAASNAQQQKQQNESEKDKEQQQQRPVKAAVFAETDDIIILRTANALLLHMADVLVSEVITHVEFLRLPSHVVALGVIALTRCLTAGRDLNEARAVILFIVKTLGISASQSLAAAELLKDKYKEALGGGGEAGGGPESEQQPCSLPKPTVNVPVDITERLKFVFGK